MPDALLEARQISVTFNPHGRHPVPAVDGVDLVVRRGEALGLVGESGSGKSTLARVLVGLQKPSAGRVVFDGVDVASLHQRSHRPQRLRLQMVFQDAFGSLNPRLTILDSLAEALPHRHQSTKRDQAVQWIEKVGLSAEDLRKYPHQFSGGQRQRLAIARALAPRPDLLIADEPVSALDASVQAQILNLFADLRRELNLALVFISHDLAVVRYLVDQVAVMRAGQVVEQGPVETVLNGPSHPYTRQLVQASFARHLPPG